jgi:aromatic-L-amino-acid decarboxylase
MSLVRPTPPTTAGGDPGAHAGTPAPASAPFTAAGQPPLPAPVDLPTAELLRAGERALEWIAGYLEHPERFPVLAQVEPGALTALLPRSAPDDPEPLDRILDDFERLIVPAITHWNHPGFMGYFGISGSIPGILGELLTAALNVNAMLWRTSPAGTELEEVALRWLGEMLGLGPDFQGGIQDTASTSTLTALAAAREAVPGLDVRVKGLAGRPEVGPLVLYASAEAHSSVDRAAIVLGLGTSGVSKVAVDEQYRMDVGDLERRIAADRAAGRLPFAVVATVGTTSTTSIDPVPEIAAVCARENLWLHVDAAYGGAAAVLPEMRHVLAGCDRADSLVVNPHKWIFIPVDCSALYCRRPDVLTGATSLVPEYLRTAEAGQARNLMDWGHPLGRRFRALKLWMVLRAYGREGIMARIREHLRLAQVAAALVDEADDLERLAPVPFSTVCLRALPRDLRARTGEEAVEHYLSRLNMQTLEAVNKSGEVFLSHTGLRGRTAIRLAIGNLRTEERHVRRGIALVREHASRLDAELRPAALR